MSRKPPGPPPAPAVQKMRVCYAKRGRLRFTSQRDFQRALERALRRIEAPMAYSAGFHPHPKISYAGAAPTGAASEAEFVELSVTREVDASDFGRQLHDALPVGLDILEAVTVTSKGSLADRLTASEWLVRLPGVTQDEATNSIDSFLRLSELALTKITKKGTREVDARGVVDSMRVTSLDEAKNLLPTAALVVTGATSLTGHGDDALLHTTMRHVLPTVRVDDVIKAMSTSCGLPTPAPCIMTRLKQGTFSDGGQLIDPLALDRVAHSN